MPAARFLCWLRIASSKFQEWKRRYGKENLHNSWIPRDFWLEDWEKRAIVDFFTEHTTDGYRRVTFMMLDSNVVAVAPATVYRVLKETGAFQRWTRTLTGKGKGFSQPEKPHDHWHVDVSYLNISGTFYYLLSVLDGYSRYIVHWEIRESMTEADAEIIIQRAREKFPTMSPRIITDNGPQFLARDFKEYIRLSGMTHVRTRPFYPQSNGKIERWHQSLKSECIRPKTPLSLEDARRLVAQFVDYYNHVRLHSAIGFVAPSDKLDGREADIFTERDRKLSEAREKRRMRRQDMRKAIMIPA
ncbi:MAG: transposase [Desulfobacteraceae bacterium]|nr:MAG: transposase [Desulfobacteraceae bacterium]